MSKEDSRTTVYVVDDHQVVRKGLSQYINESEDLIVCGGAADADTALREINTLNPDVIVVDITLGSTSGLELTKAIKERHANAKVLVHSMHQEIAYVERAIRAGASGYVVKNEPIENVIKAIRTVLDGERYLNEDIKSSLLEKFIDDSSNVTIDPVSALTNREFEVFQRIGKGYSMDEIAEELRLSVKTVQTYRERIKEKLKMNRSKDLVHFAYEWMTANM